MSTPATAKQRETATDWSVFEKLRLNPKLIRCDSYKPIHGYDASCHTTLRPKVESILQHTAFPSEHGGGFYIELSEQPEGAKIWSGWADLRAAGAEITDFRGAHRMGSPIGPVAHEILPLMRKHASDNKRQAEGGAFYFTISLPKTRSIPADEE